MELKRKIVNYLMLSLIWLCSQLAFVPLILIVVYLLQKGFSSLSWNFFTEMPKPIGELGGGLANAIVGSLKLTALACLFAVPWGVAAGVFLSEYSFGKTAKLLRLSMDLLASVPSIVVGLFVYAIIVLPMRGFSAWAGAASLSIIMIPIIARTTEEILKLIPRHVSEAGLALGISRRKVIVHIILKGAFGGVLTGIVLALARATGETAPLLFTSFNNQFWSDSLNAPTASLPVQIYTYAISPYEEWHQLAWAGALFLIIFVFSVNVATRLMFSKRSSN